MSRYVKISYNNCSLDYDYTICPWSEIEENLSLVEMDLTDSDHSEFEEYGEPSVNIEPILMTDQEYADWFEENVNP